MINHYLYRISRTKIKIRIGVFIDQKKRYSKFKNQSAHESKWCVKNSEHFQVISAACFYSRFLFNEIFLGKIILSLLFTFSTHGFKWNKTHSIFHIFPPIIYFNRKKYTRRYIVISSAPKWYTRNIHSFWRCHFITDQQTVARYFDIGK